ncbi:AsmA family protein [Methylobacillus flagellatus]|uniref:AsmA family protein n=1 Tax=Methylobacillus flagellatus TaxID=405 RepID=UPI0010F66277|nr:AsmA family protein [Methylobacillus flagellatus]
MATTPTRPEPSPQQPTAHTQPIAQQPIAQQPIAHTLPAQRRSLWRRGSAIVVGLLIALLAAGEFMGWSFLRAPAERLLSDKLERTVRLGAPFRLHLLGSIRLDVGSLYVSAPAGFGSAHLIDARDAQLTLRYGDLIGLEDTAPYRIAVLHVEKLDAHLERHQDGSASWQFKQDENSPDRPFPVIESLIVRHGTATVIDPLTAVDVKLEFDTHEGAADQHMESKVQAQGRYRQHKLAAKLVTYGFLPIASQNADSAPVKSTGWVDYGGVHVAFEGAIVDLFGKQDIQGRFTAQGPSLAVLGTLVNAVLPTTGAFVIKGQVAKKDRIWEADIASARVGSSDLAGRFMFDPRDGKPYLQGDLRGKHFMLADLGPAFGTRNADGSDAQPKAGRAVPDRPLNLPALNQMEADIKIDLAYVDLGSAFDKPISPLRAQLNLAGGKLSLSDILAHTADGTISGLISVDAGMPLSPATEAGTKTKDGMETRDGTETKDGSSPAPLTRVPAWNIDLGWKDIDLAKWLVVSKQRKQEAKAKGNQEPPAYVTGTLNGKTRLNGTGRSTAQLLASLNGDVAMHIRDGSLSHLIVEVLGLDIAQGIGVLIRGDESLAMQCAVLDLQAQQGVVSPRVAVVDTPVTLVLIDGKINLAKEQLDLRLVAKPKNFSPFTVRSPIRVRGTFLDPSVAPEAGPIAARAIGAIALSFINPLAAILPFIDAGADKPSTCAEALANYKKK